MQLYNAENYILIVVYTNTNYFSLDQYIASNKSIFSVGT